MPPTFVLNRRSLAVLDSCTDACVLALVVGCAAAISLTATTFAILAVRRRHALSQGLRTVVTATTQDCQTITTRPSSLGVIYTSFSSMYDSGRNLFVSPPNSDEMLQTTEENCEDSGTSTVEIVTPDQSPGSSPKTPILTLPSLSSMLGDFLSYGDAISFQDVSQPEQPRENVTSPFLLQQAFSATNSDVPPFSGLISTRTKVEARKVEGKKTIDTSVSDVRKLLGTTSNAAIEEANAIELNPFSSMEVEDLASFLAVDGELSTQSLEEAHLAVATTLWSILLDSTSSNLTLLPVILDDFPSVPQARFTIPSHDLPLVSTVAASNSSLRSLARSLSAPAHLNLLDVDFEDISRRIVFEPRRLIEYPRRNDKADPGQLWDEEDENLFDKFTRDVIVNRLRNTWTAGIVYSHSVGPGELWDEEDERLQTSNIPASGLDALSTFATLPFVSMEMDSETESMERTLSVDAMSDAPQSIESYDLPAGSRTFAELCICHDIFASDTCVCDPDRFGEMTVLEEDDGSLALGKLIAYSSDIDYSPETGGKLSYPSPLYYLDEEYVQVERSDYSTCSSARTSLMSLTSLQDVTIVENFSCTSLNSDKVSVDMELELDQAFSSSILSIFAQWPWTPAPLA